MNANENTILIEVLRPEISGQIQQTTLEELKNWIKDGKLHPAHKVRIKNLTWMEAQKIPAFQALFESEKITNPKAPSNHFHNQPSLTIPATAKIKGKIDGATISPEKPALSVAKISLKPEPKNAEPSVPFKLFEEKALAKSKSVEPKTPLATSAEVDLVKTKTKFVEPRTKPLQNLAEPKKKSSFIKKTIGFLAGCILIFLLSSGGAYLWVYQLKTPVEINEKNLPELSNLEDKLTSEKLNLRLKEAANKQELKNDNQENPAQPLDVSQEIAKLDKQFDIQRKGIIENYQSNLADNNFKNTFSFSFAILLFLFLLIRIFHGKNAQPFEIQNSSKSHNIQIPNSLSFPPTIIQNVHATNSSEPHSTESPNELETTDEILQTGENSNLPEALKSVNCLLHQDKPSEFVCEACANNFCAKCLKTFNQVENCCPFCKVACKSADSKINESATTQTTAEGKKKTNLLELGTNKDFVIYDFPENKTHKIGIIPAFVIALLFAASISIFWVYKISPFLENRQKEIAQNNFPNDKQTSEKNDQTKLSGQAANKSPEAANTTNNSESDVDNAADKNCIDPETKQSFECDEETRRALYEHTRKVKSVEKAQKEVSEKTGLILGLVGVSNKDESEKAHQESLKPDPVEDARKEKDKQLLIKVFISSFLIIFGLILSTRLFSKG